MASYLDLKTAVAGDLRRTDLTNEIAQEILDAIDHHSAERFWFNETRSYPLSTVIGTDTYTLAPVAPVQEFVTVDYLQVYAYGTWTFLQRVTPDGMAALTEIDSGAGAPMAWTWFADGVQLYPVPDQVYSVRVAGHFRLVPLSADADTNAWTNAARTLIRRRAVRKLNERIIRNPDVAAFAGADEMEELTRLRAETSRRTATGRIRATQW